MVHVPAAHDDEIRVDDDVAWHDGPGSLPAGVTDATTVDDGVAFDVAAGSYRFEVVR